MALNFLFLVVLLAGLPNVFSAPSWKGIGIPVTNVDAKNVISGRYIVVYHGKQVSKGLDELVMVLRSFTYLSSYRQCHFFSNRQPSGKRP